MVTGVSEVDTLPEEEATEETVLTEAELMELTLRFLFGDPNGVKATGPRGAATRADLGLVATADRVRDALPPPPTRLPPRK